MAEEKASRQGEGLSLQTLIVAAVASGIAAVVVSQLWQEGTVIAAAMTPVIVTILKEALQRPIQSEVVRRSASRVSEVATARRAVSGLAAGQAEAGRRSTPATGTVPPPPPPPSRNGDTTRGDVLASGPRRTYATSGNGRNLFGRLRGVHLKVAIVTGLLAFVIAAVVLTVPELIFGGSVSSGHNTTIFGGGKSKSTQEKDKTNGGDKNNQPNNQQQNQGGGSQSQGGSTQTQPSQPSQTQTQPQQTQPSQPPSGGGGGGASPTPKAPSPNSPAP